MNTVANYRKQAQECVELAQSARASEQPMLLNIAASWLKLADDLAAREAMAAADPNSEPQR